MAAIGCALLVVSLFDAMGSVRSADTMDSIRQLLSRPPGSGTGLSVESAVTLLRGLVLFSGALAATGTVLAVFSLRRHRGARLGLSVVAGLMLFTATFVTGFLPVLIAVATSMLWGRDARDWFAGRAAPPRQPGSPPARRGAARPLTPPRRCGRPGPVAPADRPDRPRRPGPRRRPAGPGPGGAAARRRRTRSAPARSTPGPRRCRPPDPSRRPTAVTAAAWLTWVFAGIGALFFVLLVLILLRRPRPDRHRDRAEPAARRGGLCTRQIIGALWVISRDGDLLVAVRDGAGRAGVPPGPARADRRWWSPPCSPPVLAGVAVPFGWLHAAAAIATVVLLLRGSTGRWYATGSSRRRGPGGPPVQQPADRRSSAAAAPQQPREQAAGLVSR